MKIIPAPMGGVLALTALLMIWAPSFGQETVTRETERDRKVRITEEILVVGKAPKAQPVSTVSTIDFTLIEKNRPLDLAEAIRYAPGIAVTVGNKNEFTLKLRGLDARRIALLIDGVPSYEPYYGSFDLKTVSASGLESIQITKGPSSVLYGPNTLGGIVNVLTRRPGAEPYVVLSGSGGGFKTRTVGMDAGIQAGRFAFTANAGYQDSDGTPYPDPSTGDRTEWMNTDYKRLHLNSKIYYTPSSGTEIMVNGSVYASSYGMPPALGVQRARYWRFKNWDRYALNAGGFTSLGETSTLRFRTFFVNYRNTLDQYRDRAMTNRQFESTFDNSVFGAFALADFALAPGNGLKISVNVQKDVARMQDDVGLPFDEYDQGTFSAAVEDHLSLSERLTIVGGLSFEMIDKFTGGTSSKVNPLLGIKVTPHETLDLHLSFSLKSRFPNMRSLYSPSSGNPDLLSESGRNVEAGISWDPGISLSASVFAYEFRNMIDSTLLPDGSRRYWNIGRARIRGAEIQVRKSVSWADAVLNFTYVDGSNVTDGRPLDALSDRTVNFELSLRPFSGLRLSVFGLGASASHWYDSTTAAVLEIPRYFNLDAVLAWDFGRIEFFVKGTNLLNNYIYSEPVFPWRARFFELGGRIGLL